MSGMHQRCVELRALPRRPCLKWRTQPSGGHLAHRRMRKNMHIDRTTESAKVQYTYNASISISAVSTIAAVPEAVEPGKAPLTVTTVEARQLVDQVLESIQGTDSGLQMSPEARARVDSLLDRLECIGATQQPRPLHNDLLWGDYNVAYTSVEFRLFGFLPGYVGLRGRVLPHSDMDDTVQVLFEPPVLCIANRLHLRIGGFSSVILSTTYLDERMRLGKGSRGSLFVFTRGGAADAAGMDQVGLQHTSLTAAVAFTAFFVSLFLGGVALWVSGQVVLKAAALAMWLLGAAMGGVVRRGGLVMNRDDESMAAAMKVELERRQQQKQEEGATAQGEQARSAAVAQAAV